MKWLWYVVCFWVGITVGWVCAGLLAAASRADEEIERALRSKEEEL